MIIKLKIWAFFYYLSKLNSKRRIFTFLRKILQENTKKKEPVWCINCTPWVLASSSFIVGSFISPYHKWPILFMRDFLAKKRKVSIWYIYLWIQCIGFEMIWSEDVNSSEIQRALGKNCVEFSKENAWPDEVFPQNERRWAAWLLIPLG